MRLDGCTLQDGVTAPLYNERDELKARLMAAEEALRASSAKVESVNEDRVQLQYQVKRLDEKLMARDKCATFSGTMLNSACLYAAAILL